jgi:ABC-2 type transport system permease protein
MARRRRPELVATPFTASWRAGVGWAIAFVLMIVSTVAFWPAFQDSTGLQEVLAQVPVAMLEAFGLEDLGSAAGYLKGGLYDVVIPLMFAAAGVMFANSATAAEEDSGRLELWLTQPVTRSAVFGGRVIAVLGWLAVQALVVLVSQLASDAVFGLEIADTRVAATVLLCTLLGTVFAGVAIAIAGFIARPGLVLAIGLGLALAGYLVAALFPLSGGLEGWAWLSPWDWAMGSDPLANPTEAGRFIALAGVAGVLILVGGIAFARRDIRSA